MAEKPHKKVSTKRNFPSPPMCRKTNPTNALEGVEKERPTPERGLYATKTRPREGTGGRQQRVLVKGLLTEKSMT